MTAHSHLLERALQTLLQNPSPEIPKPPSCNKRASVALVLRIRPSLTPSPPPLPPSSRGPPPPPPPPAAAPPPSSIANEDALHHFFAQPWVRHGDPEILFIRRAARRGDRWTGHVAFPGGKRDPGDDNDRAAAEREACEEVGLDLSTCAGGHSSYVGNLPQQVVSTNWGNVPLMVLCPFVYLLTSPTNPPLRLQPAEVASAHWVSVRALLHPSLRTYEACDISERLTRPGGWLTRHALRLLVGQMLYPATRLVPSESLFCSSAPGFLPSEEEEETAPSMPRRLYHALCRPPVAAGVDRPLHLWGLTFGIVTDFLQLLPTYEHQALWAWPTFSHWDIQFVLWLSAWMFRRRALRDVHRGRKRSSINFMEDGFASTSEAESPPRLGGEHVNGSDALLRQGAGGILEGYFDQIKTAVLTTMGLRASLGTFLIILLARQFRRRAVRS